jgi:hypothetical protein
VSLRRVQQLLKGSMSLVLSLGELAALGVALQLGARQDVLWWRGLVGCSGREDNIGIQGMRCSGWAPSVGVAGVGMSSGLCILGAARAANLAARAANLLLLGQLGGPVRDWL